MFTLGVIADTHIPDRVRRLHPGVIPTFRQARVGAILHAGDISSPRVLNELRNIAPVYAVRGNRDWFFLPFISKTPLVTKAALTFNGNQILLTHGHGNMWQYLGGHFTYLRNGENNINHIQARLCAEFPEADVIVFGHLHQTVNQWVGRQLLFNPGSPHFPNGRTLSPSIGLLQISAEGEVQGQIVPLN